MRLLLSPSNVTDFFFVFFQWSYLRPSCDQGSFPLWVCVRLFPLDLLLGGFFFALPALWKQHSLSCFPPASVIAVCVKMVRGEGVSVSPLFVFVAAFCLFPFCFGCLPLPSFFGISFPGVCSSVRCDYPPKHFAMATNGVDAPTWDGSNSSCPEYRTLVKLREVATAHSSAKTGARLDSETIRNPARRSPVNAYFQIKCGPRGDSNIEIPG